MSLWLARAESDLLAVRAILGASLPSYETAAFHIQQAAEKSLKALLVRHRVSFGKTHNIAELLALAEPTSPGIADALRDARALTPYAVDARYPAEAATVDKAEAARSLGLGARVLAHVKALLSPYLDAGRPEG